MEEFLIILIGIWIYPVISLIFFLLTKRRLELRKRIFRVQLIITGLTLLGILLNISTTLTILDWILVSGIYLTISLVLWWTQFQMNKSLKILGFIATIIIFASTYLIGSIGVLGIGFVIEEYAVDTQMRLGNNLIYKASNLGNAISDYRGKKIGIYRTIAWMPIIEWRIKEKKYSNWITYGDKLSVQYSQSKNEIYLSTSAKWEENRVTYWSDTLSLK